MKEEQTISEIAEIKTIWTILEDVFDPEVPVLSVIDLGVVRAIEKDGETIVVTITPTYSGCPAMGVIELEIRMRLISEGYKQVNIKTILSPAWTTDWMSAEGKRKLEAYGIAPPVEPVGSMNELFGKDVVVNCPQCQSNHTELVSQFGSTACKALYKCLDCKEPFDYFKCHR